jgi:hypothetical protein
MQAKTMYHVEKFLPTECPKCRAPFQCESKDYGRFLGDIVDGKKQFRQTEGHTIIVCGHCENFTVRIDLESYQLGDRKKAEALLQQGFVNLQEVTAMGNMAVDHHVVYQGGPKFLTDEPESDDPHVVDADSKKGANHDEENVPR